MTRAKRSRLTGSLPATKYDSWATDRADDAEQAAAAERVETREVVVHAVGPVLQGAADHVAAGVKIDPAMDRRRAAAVAVLPPQPAL